jgi:glycosyltransferase involved in cell wall biosynthesis
VAPLPVAFDIGALLGPLTGVGTAVAGMEAALAARDDVELIPYACSFRGELRPGDRRLPIPAALAHRLWAHTSHPQVDRWLRPARVVHGTNYVVGPARAARVVSVYDCWFLRHPGDANPDVVRAGQVLRRAVAHGATVHASSAATAAACRELLRTERVETIPLGPPPDPPPARDRPDGPPYVLALGTLERRKNVPRLVEAFGKLVANRHDVALVLAGADGDDRAAIDAAIDALPATARSRVDVRGRVDAATKATLLAHAAVLAYPSLDEGFGFPLLEAMQRRVPVVASTAGSIPEVAGDAALLVDAADCDALADALATVLDDDEVSSRLIEAGSARLAAFSWQATGEGLAALYHRLARSGG